MRLQEEDVRRGDFHRAETRITEAGEIDIYRADEVPGLDIRINLVRDARDSVIFSSMHVVTSEGRPVVVEDEDGEVIDRELVEVMAWEFIEYLESAADYMTGRSLLADDTGNPLTAGVVVKWESEDSAIPEPA